MLAPGVCMSITEARYINDGKGTLVNPEKFNKQDYQQLKQDFFKHRYRYIDDTFPPDNTSIGKVIDGVVWKRPRELVKNPNFIVSDISRFDFGQGNVGNCWFLASIGALTYQKDILNQVIDSEQNFEYGYCGIFHFRFWRFGKWVDVVIDDKLPTLQGKLIFVQSRTSNEFWPALLEKAYAKVCGSYADMDAGTLSEAMMDFTGGIHITYSLEKAPPNIWHVLLRAAKSQSMIGCTTPHGEIPGENKVAPNGLVCGHAYTVTGVTQVMSRDMPVNLVRVFNPWGFGEWEGDWSDRSSLWETVYPEERQKYLSVAIDGEFWMTVEDFCKNFNEVTICCLNLNFLDENITSVWTASFHNGRWLADITAGGHETFEKTFWMNPQYRVKIDELENDCSEYNILVSLMQKSKSGRRRFEKNLFIGFSVYEVPDQSKGKRGKFPASFFNTSRLVKKTMFHVDSREVMEKFRLKPGEYLIVPSTSEPKQSRSFILSILTKAKINVYENSNVQDEEEILDTPKSPTSPTPPETPKPRSDSGLSFYYNPSLFQQYYDEFEEVDAEQLQRILNENLLKGFTKGALGFSLESCQSMVALMDMSVTGKLNSAEFKHLWDKVTMYRDIFFHADVDHSGNLSLSELRNAMIASGLRMGDDMLCLMALRYGGSSGNISVESFISLVLRMNTMAQIFRHLEKGGVISLREKEWMQISMYT